MLAPGSVSGAKDAPKETSSLATVLFGGTMTTAAEGRAVALARRAGRRRRADSIVGSKPKQIQKES